MIQFNLLPDVKLEFIKAQRMRRLVLGISILVSTVSVVVLVLLLSVDGLQKKHLSDLNNAIASETGTLQRQPNINTILTVQNQLESLTQLHNSKPAADRLFDYLNELTPAPIAITNFTADYDADTMTITGTADTLSSVNQYVDTLKLTTYTVSNSSTAKPAFSNVVLSAFGYDTNPTNPSEAATFTITFSYDKSIFDITKNISLSVPTTTTRAQLQDPTDLFKASSSEGTQ
jgi:Tfp pilus assembly protein PilN